jgi:hypothetical protein
MPSLEIAGVICNSQLKSKEQNALKVPKLVHGHHVV